MKIVYYLLLSYVAIINTAYSQPAILKPYDYKHYVDFFNKNDDDIYPAFISNESSWDFLSHNIPLLDCPDKVIEQTYYFRWWTYRKHIKKTPEGFVITEFLPDVPWAGKYNAICCPAGHHFYEGRWLRNSQYLDQYAAYWLNGEGEPRKYSFWAADAIYNYCMVSGDFSLAEKLLPDLIGNYESWEKEHLDPNGLFWQKDDRDGMEVSICGQEKNGDGYRATINAYMYGDAIAIANIAQMLNKPEVAEVYKQKAATIKDLVQEKLWDKNAQFFKVLPRGTNTSLCNARELHGYTPWYFNLPDTSYAIAWKFAMDPSCFFAPFGLTSAQRNHPGFRLSYEGHECQWNGPSWPFATSITLTALANLINNNDQDHISKQNYYQLLKIYAQSQQRKKENGITVPWIDENINPLTGDWISRTRLKTWENGTWSKEKGGIERGKDYNHSTFCDLIITGLIGLRPAAKNIVIINPLLPDNTWNYFCLDNILYHKKRITILYDKTGKRYKKGKGLLVFINGKKANSLSKLGTISVRL